METGRGIEAETALIARCSTRNERIRPHVSLELYAFSLTTKNVSTMLVLAIIGAALGASLASFCNVIAYRLPRGLSIVQPRSMCAACSTPIAWHDNVPVLSFLTLRGCCRACRAAIPIVSLILETAGAVAGFAIVYALLR